MQKKPNGLGRGLGALLNPEIMKIPDEKNLLSEKASQQMGGMKTETNQPLRAHKRQSAGAEITQPKQATPTIDSLTTHDLVERLSPTEHSVVMLNPGQMSPLKDQPRTEFYSNTLDELAASIKSYGIIQPIVVCPSEQKGHFTIIAGERRWRAAQIAGLQELPCVVRASQEHSALEVALIENIQREELSPLDEAKAFSRLMDEHSYTQETLASKVGKDRATIANSLRLLGLPQEILADLQAKIITAGHARAICSLDEKKLQLKVRDMIVSKKLSVRQTEDVVKELKKNRDAVETGPKQQLSQDLRQLCDQFKGHLGTKVRISGDADRGKIEISYYTFEDLERIAELMLSPGINPRRPL